MMMISDASSRRGRSEAALDWHLLQSIVDGAIDAIGAIDEWHKNFRPV